MSTDKSPADTAIEKAGERGPPFTEEDAERAYNEWGCNCGPGALAAVLGMTLDAVRPHLKGFDQKRYTNPTMMFGALKSIGAKWNKVDPVFDWPRYGLCRVQWEGPWTNPGVPARVAYRYTHWIGVNARTRGNVGIFDINCMNNGTGWCAEDDWVKCIVPHLTAQYPHATGVWRLTHSLEVSR